MAEPTPEAVAAADRIVAAWLAQQPAGRLPGVGIDRLILAVAKALDSVQRGEPLERLP